jgi:hypothetical protein
MNHHYPFASARRLMTIALSFFISLTSQVVFAQPLSLSDQEAAWQDVITNSGSGFQPRHESGYVAVNGKFYLTGGRGNRALNIYDPSTNEWTEGATVPNNNELHHFQAINFQNKLYIIGAFTGGFPEETPVADIYIYDPATNEWEVRIDAIPAERRRGAAGAVVYNGKIYLVGGITNGHTNGWVKWFDSYDPLTGAWEILPDAPHERDHFHAVTINNNLYAVAGRKTGFTSLLGDTETAIDVFNFETGMWTTLAESTRLPTPRAGAATFNVDGKIIVAGGESDANGAHNNVESFDPINNIWSDLPKLNNGRHGIQAIYNEGRIFIAGGWGYIGSSGEELQTQESLKLSDVKPHPRPLLLKPFPDVTLKTDTLPLLIDLSNYFQSPDGSALNYSVSYTSPNSIISSTGIEYPNLSIKFSEAKTGYAEVSVRATNDQGLFTVDKFIITIRPALLVAPKIIDPLKDEKLAYNTQQVKIFLGNVFSDDKDVKNLVYTLANVTNKNIINSTEIIGDSLFIKFKPNAIGRTALYVKATDEDNLSATDVFLLEFVSKTLLQPKVAAPLNDLLLLKNSAARYIHLSSVFTTANPGVDFKLSVTNSNPKILVTKITGDSLLLLPVVDSIGQAKLTVTATSENGTVSDDFNVNLVELNGSPVFVRRINSGGGLINFKGEKWMADSFYKAGTAFKQTSSISGTGNQEIYHTERHGDFRYAIPVPSGKYNVKLHFAELYFKLPGERLFNINIEKGQKSIDSFDIISFAGAPSIAIVRQVDSIVVKDDTLNIDFSSIQNFAKISAIEVLSVETHKFNHPPFVSFAIPDQEMKYDDTLKEVNLYKVFSDDLGSVPLKLTIDEISDSSKIISAKISGLSLSLKKAPLQSGITSIRVRATDNLGQSAVEEFLLTINEPAPSRPVVFRALPDINEKMNAVIPSIKLGKVFFDNRGSDQLVYTANAIATKGLFTDIRVTGDNLSINLNKNAHGSEMIRIRATDKDGLYTEDEFLVNIINTDTTSLPSFLINAGGESVRDASTQWQSDNWFSGGNSYTYNEYSAAAADSILKTERFGNFSYKIPLPDGTYKVKLHFAELFWRNPGERIFNVEIENGQGGLKEYDILAKAGAPAVRVIEEFKGINIKDGFLDISFETLRDNAKISGIEIIGESSTGSSARLMSIESIQPLNKEMNFRIYPNPLTGSSLNIELPENFVSGSTQLSIVNIDGAVVYRMAGIKNNTRLITLQLPDKIVRGTYMVLLNNGSSTKITKLIKQ